MPDYQCSICSQAVSAPSQIPLSGGRVGNHVFKYIFGLPYILFSLCDEHLARHGGQFCEVQVDKQFRYSSFDWVDPHSSAFGLCAYAPLSQMIGIVSKDLQKGYLYIDVPKDVAEAFTEKPSGATWQMLKKSCPLPYSFNGPEHPDFNENALIQL